MKVKYKLLYGGEGILISRTPEIITDELLCFEFESETEGLTAIFETEDGSFFYRRLTDGKCSLPLSRLDGIIKVTAAELNGQVSQRRWKCEELKLTPRREGEFLIFPNDTALRDVILNLKLEGDALRKSQELLEKKYKALEDKLRDIMEGYSLT